MRSNIDDSETRRIAVADALNVQLEDHLEARLKHLQHCVPIPAEDLIKD